MTIDQAHQQVKNCTEHMNARYGRVVFDEWAIVSLSSRRAKVLTYDGPRKENFQKNFLTDAGSLQTGLLKPENEPGDFEFARDGIGTGFESFMVLGRDVYLICNNTVQSMDNISRDPLWLSAQVPFVDLSEKVRSNPVSV
jgi:hypothetical protein